MFNPLEYFGVGGIIVGVLLDLLLELADSQQTFVGPVSKFLGFGPSAVHVLTVEQHYYHFGRVARDSSRQTRTCRVSDPCLDP